MIIITLTKDVLHKTLQSNIIVIIVHLFLLYFTNSILSMLAYNYLLFNQLQATGAFTFQCP